ncbi:MAG: DUF2442 domain-containing protein [Armatimonadota bacterium]
MIRVTSVEPVDNCKIRVSFSDGLQGIVDLSEIIGRGVFESLKDPSEFAKVYVDEITHTVAWPGGIDLCPDSLHHEIAQKQRAA